ncbi:uncharacterized protein PFL1_04227 [Pseudozyma flocculosa PF-1]|uniref:Diphthamide biosynthesis protein 4 n=1 Tax=Pseudozyma flocculosa PF-1 TaxID=1277687 RepID=A0A061H8Q7_9BASI|nr:uncharacterized protein PFL1_04227 [Pseudozyma flocculosa PF-1]EPQ28400.1 hypothetical protein PFL1_04227 [Pseudozyma flocculosa PF-1]
MGQSTSKAIPSDAAAVEIPSRGSIRGVLLTDAATAKPKTQRFSGIPYAQPPVGPLRWRRPQPLSPDFSFDDGGRRYHEPGNVCPQPLTYFANTGFEIPPQPLAYNKSEDCLQLTIWVPVDEHGQRKPPSAGKQGLPVLFFIHGGWLQIGNPNLDVNKDPSDLIASAGLDCIVVSPGYRLNAFGFLAHNALRDEDESGLTGNYGFWDQRLALEWVRDNIAHFGGDPGNIAIGGISAGAHSSHSQLLHEFDLCRADPSYRPIIKRVFLQSNAVAWPPKRVEETAEQFEELCAALDIPISLADGDKIERLRKVGDVELAEVVTKLDMHTFRAVRDDRPGAFVRSSWTSSMADGSFGRWCEEQSITVLAGEVDKEEKVYEVVNSPHDLDSFVLQLTNYYPEALVQAILPLYGLPQTKKMPPLGASALPTSAGQHEAVSDSDRAASTEGGELEDLYTIFGVSRTASKAEIRAAYLGLVRQHHPDKAQQSDSSLLAPDTSSSALIRQLNTAYSILSDDLTRQAYDRALEAQISQAEAAKQQRDGKGQAMRLGGEGSDDSDSDSEDDERGEEVTFVHPCRCGHDYRISGTQISQGVELVACNGCSEVVRVTWFDHDDPATAAAAAAVASASDKQKQAVPTTAREWAQLFGQVSADSQVYLTSRTLIEDLVKGGMAPHAILRYRCDFRAPIFDTFAPASMGVSHSFDDLVWWYALCTGGWTEQQLKRLRKWLDPYIRFLHGPPAGTDVREWREDMAVAWYGPEYDVDTTTEASWIRTLKADATIQVEKTDQRGDDKRSLIRAMREIREKVAAT